MEKQVGQGFQALGDSSVSLLGSSGSSWAWHPPTFMWQGEPGLQTLGNIMDVEPRSLVCSYPSSLTLSFSNWKLGVVAYTYRLITEEAKTGGVYI